MEFREINEWLVEAEKTITFLQKTLKDIKTEESKKIVALQQGINYYKEELAGLHKLQESKTVVKRDVSSYLLEKIREMPEYQRGVKLLEEGGDVNINLTLKQKSKNLPPDIYIEPGSKAITREVEGLRDDEETRASIEKRIRSKEMKKDREGYSYD